MENQVVAVKSPVLHKTYNGATKDIKLSKNSHGVQPNPQYEPLKKTPIKPITRLRDTTNPN